MSIESEIGRSLSLFKTFDLKVKIVLKSKKIEPFTARVQDFNFKEDDDRIIFKRCEETIFPTDTDEKKESSYMIYIKNIKSVEKILPSS